MIRFITLFMGVVSVLQQGDFNYLPQEIQGQIVNYDDFTLCYNELHKQANWVAYELTKEELLTSFDIRDYYSSDVNISHSASREDYKYQPYDRGQLCSPKYCTSSITGFQQAFMFSNVSPQVRSINRYQGAWTKLEELEMLYANRLGRIYAISGPIFKDTKGTIGPNKVTVPGYFFKAILSGNLDRGIGFLIENSKENDEPYAHAISLNQLELETGFDFFHSLPDSIEEKLEGFLDLQYWKSLEDPSFVTSTNPDISEVPPSTIKIATFNIQIFGKTKTGKQQVMDTLASIVRKYDIVAIQEIKDKSGNTPNVFLDEINKTDSAYALVLSQRSGTQAGHSGGKEQYAYYYNFNRIRSFDSGNLYPDELDRFVREPFLAKFETRNGNFSFVLSSIHTQPDNAIQEIEALHDVVNWARSIYTDEDDFITLGDFNASCDYAKPEQLDELEFRTDEYIWIVPDNADTNVSITSECAYDRIVITENLGNEYTNRWGIDRSFSNKIVSDHFPVWAEFYIDEN